VRQIQQWRGCPDGEPAVFYQQREQLRQLRVGCHLDRVAHMRQRHAASCL
jgi:hypothetical protein